MTMRRAVVGTAFSVSLMSSAVLAGGVPRTPAGHPDLQGTWSSATITTLERPLQVEPLVIDDRRAAAWEARANERMTADAGPTDPGEGAPEAGGNIGGYNSFWMDPGTRLMRIDGHARTSIVVEPDDGRVPYHPATRRLMASRTQAFRTSFDNPEDRLLGERCIVGFGSTGGPPMLPVLYNNHYQIVQTPDHVMILVEMNHDARIVRVGGEHLPREVTPWLGDSIGWWDGDTLVVETTNFNPGQSFRLAIKHRVFVSPTARVIERFSRVADDELRYDFVVEDPDATTTPWRGEMSWRRTADRIFEYACHEGNYALHGILAGARAEEAAARADTPEHETGE